MNCDEFQSLWDERIDRMRGPGRIAVDASPELDEHAAHCPSCRAVHEGWTRLERALDAWPAPAEAPVGLADRIESEWSRALASGQAPPRMPAGRIAVRLALAASALLALGVTWRLGRDGRGSGPAPAAVATETTPGRQPAAGRGLDVALAEATGVTLGLARAASGPAGRIGRAVLDLAPGRPAIAPQMGLATNDAPGRLKAVADRIGSGLGPISGTARSAFGFLMGPASAPDGTARPDAGRSGS